MRRCIIHLPAALLSHGLYKVHGCGLWSWRSCCAAARRNPGYDCYHVIAYSPVVGAAPAGRRHTNPAPTVSTTFSPTRVQLVHTYQSNSFQSPFFGVLTAVKQPVSARPAVGLNPAHSHPPPSATMPPQLPPLDEMEFDQPGVLQTLPGGATGTLSEATVLWYLMNSPFFDPGSNNIAAINQLRHRQDGGEAILSNPKAYQEHVASFTSGMHYVVVSEPPAQGEPWVVQRQTKVPGEKPGTTAYEVEGTYYTAGTKVLMAPNVLDVVRLRLLSCSTQIAELMELSKDLTRFSPATGHSYLPPSYALPKAASTASRVGSRLGSPSLAPTEPADGPPASQSQPAESTAASTEYSDALFMDSFRLTNSYYHEFMDENPLTGEPGSFVFTNTHAAVYARNLAREKQQEQKATASTSTVAGNKAETQATGGSVAATPLTTAAEASSRKASIASLPKLGKEKRRKSKGLGSPVTPGPS